VLDFFPLIGWLAAATSLVTLIMLAAAGELRPRSGTVWIALFLIAAYLQFFSGLALVRAVGLGLQTLLAIVLIVRWQLSA
jgi:hypothetical protein